MFGEAILEEVVKRGLSGRQVSLAAVGHESAIRSLKRGVDPRASTLQALSDVLGLEFYIGPPRDLAALPPSIGRVMREIAVLLAEASRDPEGWQALLNHLGALDAAQEVKIYNGVFCTPYPMPEGETATRVSPHSCAWFGAGMISALDIDPEQCKAVEIADDSMAPALPARSVALVDLRRTKRRAGAVYAVDASEGLTMRRAALEDGRWMAVADHSGWKPHPWAEGRVLGEAVWRAKMLPVGPPPGPDGLAHTPTHPPPGTPACRMVPVITDDAEPVAVPWRGRLEPASPRDFWMETAAWFGEEWLDVQGVAPLRAEVVVPGDAAMAPSLWRDSPVLVDRQRDERLDGAIFEIATKDGLMLRRLTKDGRQWMVSADDPTITPRPWARPDEIVGQAIWTAGLMP